MSTRIYLEVDATFKADGTLIPRSFLYSGNRYEIDRVIGTPKRLAAAGYGPAMRYIVMVEGAQKQLWLDDEMRWFAERR